MGEGAGRGKEEWAGLGRGGAQHTRARVRGLGTPQA